MGGWDGNVSRADIYVRKNADESVTSSAALQNDDHLFCSIDQGGTYLIDVWLQALSAANAAGDIQVAFTFPTGTMTTWVQGADDSLASGRVSTGQWRSDTLGSGTAFALLGLSTSAMGIHIVGNYTATATGTLQLQWAQAVSSPSASVVKTGSFMRVTQVA